LCERFGCLPSALEREDARLLRLVEIEALGRRSERDGEHYDADGWARLQDQLDELRSM
jgi:hypothetical protein